MTISRIRILAAITNARLAAVMRQLPSERRRGRPWSRSHRHRVLITCVAVRTNLTMRELAAVFQISKSAAHRIVATVTRALGALHQQTLDHRARWIVDGTLIPTRDHTCATRSKNYRWSCNAQILVRWKDLRVVAATAGGPGSRNDPIHYRGSLVEQLCKTTEACWPMAAIAVCRSSSRRSFEVDVSYVMGLGVGIVAAEHASNMPSQGSRTGAFYATIVDEGATLRAPSLPLLSSNLQVESRDST